MTSPNLGSTQLAQVAVIVRDIEASSKRYAEIFGLPVPKIITLAPGLEVNQTYNGEPSDARAKLAFFQLGQVQLELIEPLGGNSTWQDYLDRKGEGLHHIAFWVDGMQKRVDFLRTQNIRMIQRGDMNGGQYAYFDAEGQLGLILELLENQREARAVE